MCATLLLCGMVWYSFLQYGLVRYYGMIWCVASDVILRLSVDVAELFQQLTNGMLCTWQCTLDLPNSDLSTPNFAEYCD